MLSYVKFKKGFVVNSFIDYFQSKMGGVNPVLGCLKEFWWFKKAFIMVATPLLLTIMLPYYEQMGLTKPVRSFI